MTMLLISVIFLVSFVLTMVGLGGGLVFSPLFLLIGYAKAEAASASLFLNLLAAASAALTYSRKKMVDYSLSIPLIISSALAAPMGALMNVHIDRRPFLVILAIVLSLAGLRMLSSPGKRSERAPAAGPFKIAGSLGIGMGVGFIGGLLGIGGGVFIVPLMIYLLHVPTKVAAASSTFIVCFSSLTGFLGYASMAAIDWRFILPAAAASFTGGLLGARIMSTRMKAPAIRRIFSLILLLMSAKLLHQALFS